MLYCICNSTNIGAYIVVNILSTDAGKVIRVYVRPILLYKSFSRLSKAASACSSVEIS